MKSRIGRGFFVFALVLMALYAACATAQETTLALGRTVPAGNYTPGATLDIQITFTKSGDQTITALGLYETLPIGWTFNSVVSGSTPQFYLSEGNEVEFGWFMIPSFPASFIYRVNVPTPQSGTKEISGYAEYRTGGGPLLTPTVVTQIPGPPSAPDASFTAFPTAGCAPLEVEFTDTSTGSPTTWAWDFGDGGTSSSQNPVHTYASPGIYSVSLTVTNTAGSDSVVQDDLISIYGPPTASFTAAPTQGCAPLAVDFTDTSTGDPTSWAWDFGDGATGSGPITSHTYVTPGVYYAVLTASNGCGQDDHGTYITVGGAPDAAFTVDDSAGCAPFAVQFTDISTGNPTSYDWDFGDGATGVGSSPSHTYATPGTFTVTLTVSNQCGEDTVVQTDLITVGSAPVAAFGATPTQGCAPLLVEFTDTSTGDPNEYLWDFGDGQTSTSTSPSHTYNVPGTYTVTLTVTNACGSDAASEQITVGGPPVASFTADPTTGCAPLLVAFTDTSTGNPTSYAWNFGDGSTSTEANPSHSYVSPGLYTVTLNVENSCGADSAVESHLVVVNEAPEASFTAAPEAGCAPLPVQFTDTSTGNPTSYTWDFGDGATSTLANPSHTFAASGSYTVTLTVSSGCGEDTATQVINVGGAPEASFTAEPAAGCAPLLVAFTDTSTGSPTTHLWDFGDGSTSSAVNPTHTFASLGTYSVTLTVSNDCGEDTVVQTGLIVVSGPPTASFTADPTSGETPLPVEFTDTSTGNPTSWAWDFGDGGTSTSANPSHTYTTAGAFTVTLTVTSACGSDDASAVINVSQGNRPPVLAGIGNLIVNEAQVLTVGLSATDPDGDGVAFSGAGMPAYCTLTDYGDGTAELELCPDYTCAGVCPAVTITVTDDGSPVLTDAETITITVNNVNRAPVANAGGNFGVQVAQTAVLDGSSSSDPDGDLITYNWSFDSVPAGSGLTSGDIVEANQPDASFTPDVAGNYVLGLVVSDGDLPSEPDFVTVMATSAPNVPPVAVAGGDQSAVPGVLVSLDGSGSYDSDGGPDALAYVWLFESVPAGSALTSGDISGANTAFAAFTPDVYGDFVVSLVVDDGADVSDPDLVTISVGNATPNADAGADQSVTLGETACVDGSGSDDPDGGPAPLTFSWTFVSVAAGSALTNADIVDADTATPCFVPDVVGSYVLELLVSDSVLSDTDNVMVAVNEPGEMENVDDLVKVQFSHHKHRLDRETRMITSTAQINIRNNSDTTISVPMEAIFIIDNADVTMPDAHGVSDGNYFYDVGLAGDIQQLAPGERVAFEIKFVYQFKVRFDFTVEIWGVAL